MVRILGSTGSRRRRAYQLGAIASLVALLAVLAVPNALAVHDLDFQLEGDVVDTNPGPAPFDGAFDWASFFDASGNEAPTLPDPSRPGFEAASFDRDFVTNPNGSFNTSDTSTFATGSKDTLPITPGWQCNFDNNVNSKIDIMNAYALAFTDPVTDHEILYFALERNANTGDANVGFWFLQDEVACESAGGSTAFTGDHTDGDLLIVSAFTSGGTVSTIDVYRWNGGADGSLGTTSVAHGVDCKTTGGGDTACATVNAGSITTPWLTSNKQDGPGNTLRVSEFFEGGLDLTAANLGDRCFNTFIGDTRSSQSLTATLFDFSLGVLGECQSFIVTTPSISSEEIPAHGTLDVMDSADITVTGVDTFSGTVTFFLCRSSELDSNGECSTGGTQIGSPQSVTANGTFVSDAAGLTAVDHYCWRADFSGDTNAGVPPKSDHSTNECFDVTPLQPTLTTDATDGPVDFGDPISDTISLTGTADTPGSDGDGPGGTIDATNRQPADGTISFTAFGPGDCTTVAHSGTITVSGDNTAYGGPGSVTEFTPTVPGTYTYVASYTGDSPNTLGVPATACPDPTGAEEVTVRQIPTDIMTKQSWFPQDTATVSATAGNLGADGTVTFELFDNATCDGTALYEETVGITGGSPSEEVGTSNTTFEVTTGYNDAAGSTAGPYSWRVTYRPNASDTAHTGARSTCDSENFSITYTNDPGPGADLP